jgi:hypothetical protein
MWNGSFSVVGGSAFFFDKAPSFTICNTSGYADTLSVDPSGLKRYKTMCVITSSGRHSVLAIKSVASDKVAFKVTTYVKDGD